MSMLSYHRRKSFDVVPWIQNSSIGWQAVISRDVNVPLKMTTIIGVEDDGFYGGDRWPVLESLEKVMEGGKPRVEGVDEKGFKETMEVGVNYGEGEDVGSGKMGDKSVDADEYSTIHNCVKIRSKVDMIFDQEGSVMALVMKDIKIKNVPTGPRMCKDNLVKKYQDFSKTTAQIRFSFMNLFSDNGALKNNRKMKGCEGRGLLQQKYKNAITVKMIRKKYTCGKNVKQKYVQETVDDQEIYITEKRV
ncbi:hypothetical protein BC829DRAFT_415473 [Chytridium lagenaria]|nr:hypothetical protein BC829DRAFT_415473 [Chytridium lagenaria]